MSNRYRLMLIVGGALLVAVVFTYPLWRPLFVNDVVEEPFPGLTTSEQTAFQQLPADKQTALKEMLKANATMAVEMAKAAVSPDQVVPTAEQAMPDANNPVIIADGSFIQIDVIHGASGKANIYQLPDNTLVLRLEDFKATNGPDLHVLLTRNPDPRKPEDVGNDYIDLGKLKGNVGSQNYSVPSEVNFNDYRAVVIFCLPFQVVFSVASLTAS